MTHSVVNGSRLAIWLGLAAIWLQVLVPLALHSTSPFAPPALLTIASDSDDDDDDGCALQHGHDEDDHAAMADHHGHHACTVCQALHHSGGTLGPAQAVLLASVQLAYAVALYAIPLSADYRAIWPRAGHARAPPSLVN